MTSLASSLLTALGLGLVLWLGPYGAYLLCNHGLAPNARLQQLLRYLAAAVVAVVPLAVTAATPLQPALLLTLAVSTLWMVTYPLTYHLTHRHDSPDYDHQIDPAFGIYLYGWLTALQLLLPAAGWLWGLLLALLLVVVLFEWGYYLTCHHVVDASGMKMLQETHVNEVIEFVRSYALLPVALAVLLVAAAVGAAVVVPVLWPAEAAADGWWRTAVVLGVALFQTVYLWKPHHGLFVRTGIAQLYRVVAEYVANNRRYAESEAQRLADLKARVRRPLAKPHTVLLVIGESASRDFMSAYVPTMAEDTTPWLRQLAADTVHTTLFPNAYSCDIQTVPTLEKALTEYNQYDAGRQFYTSCSIVDVAHRLGYRVYWYSNQGHLGAADTPITLVAETADVARWTRQEVGKAQYDETLIDMLHEVDPSHSSLVVLHLKGSHFNYENRFTEPMRQWGSADSHDQVTNYKNTLYYTDQMVLRRAFDYARQHLNLQAMVYFSDHADVPDRHRQPNFGGFRDTRIPLVVWLGDDYIATRPDRAAALAHNRQRYWTNDLAYELLCGLLDADSPHFSEDNSLASADYRFSREELTAMNGRIRIADDNHAD